MRRRVTPSLVISVIALFVALSGASYAAIKLPINAVGTAQIKKDAVTSAKVKDGSLLAGDFKAGQLPAGAKGETGAKGDTGQRGPSDAYVTVVTSDPVVFGSRWVVMATTPMLPAGSYIVTGLVNLARGGISGQLVQVSCKVEEDAPSVINMGLGSKSQLSLSSTITLAEPSAVSFGCSASFDDIVTADMRNIIATRVDTLTTG